MKRFQHLWAKLASERGAIEISDLSSILKKIIAPAIQRQLFKETVLLDKIKKNSGIIRMPNNTFYVPMQVGHHSGIYSVAEGGQILKGEGKYAQPSVSAKYTFGSFEITDQAIEAANDSMAAIATVLNENSMSLKTAFRKEINRICHGDGTGRLCLVNGASSGTTLTVDTPGTEHLREGGSILVNALTKIISSVDSDTQVTLTTSASVNDNDVVTRAAADEGMGLKGAVDDGDFVATIQGIARASNPYAVSYTDDTAEQLTEADLITAWLKSKKFGNPKALLMNEVLFQRYGSILTSMKRSADLKEVLSGGWKGLDFMGGDGAVMLDYDTPTGFVQVLDFDAFTIGEMTPISWLDRGAGVLTKVPDYAKWEGTMRYYWNLIVKNFRANSRLSAKTA